MTHPLTNRPQIRRRHNIITIHNLRHLHILRPLRIRKRTNHIRNIRNNLRHKQLINMNSIRIINRLINYNISIHFQITFQPFILRPNLHLSSLPTMTKIITLRLINSRPSLRRKQITRLPPTITINGRNHIRNKLRPLIRTFPIIRLPLFRTSKLLLPSNLLMTFILSNTFNTFPTTHTITTRLIIRNTRLLNSTIPTLSRSLIRTILKVDLDRYFSSLLI